MENATSVKPKRRHRRQSEDNPFVLPPNPNPIVRANVAKYAERYANCQDIWTGNDLEGQALKECIENKRSREFTVDYYRSIGKSRLPVEDVTAVIHFPEI